MNNDNIGSNINYGQHDLAIKKLEWEVKSLEDDINGSYDSDKEYHALKNHPIFGASSRNQLDKSYAEREDMNS